MWPGRRQRADLECLLGLFEMTVLNRDKWNISAGLDGSEESEESKTSGEIIHMSRSCVLGIQIFPMGHCSWHN